MAWIDVGAADELTPGGIMTLERESGDVVIWRSVNGVVSACDSRCPHQWAHLGAAGAVDGEELVCLSHFWRFDPSGAGSKLAATGRRDEKSPVPTFEVREVAGRLEVQVPDL